MAPHNAVSNTARCAACSSPLVEISLARAGSTVTMRSCTRCDTRSWHDETGASELGEVLKGLAAARTAPATR